ncbi:MAG TPA: GNAT family N-acetyltransferase [Mycobacteriales bacterium]|nr:GNAT family N-acetyltransferase [Mycobacteriales bacterium]
MLRAAPIRVLDDRDLPVVLGLLSRDPIANVFVQSRVEAAGLQPWRLGAEMWGHVADGQITGLCYAGANLVPVEGDDGALRAFADRARRQGRRCSSIVGPARLVAPLWQLLEPTWGAARDVRPRQPLMLAEGPCDIEPDPLVRRVRTDEVDVLLPASIAMFTEEVGVSPVAADGGTLYRARVTELVQAGRSFARIEGDRVVFKAEVGAVTRAACQVQGVWVDPTLRGQGLSVRGMAAVLQLCLDTLAPAVTLYVNDFNAPARRAYERVGFRDVGTFMSVLF